MLLEVREVRWRDPHSEEQKQILRNAYPIAHNCAMGPQACVAQDDTDFEVVSDSLQVRGRGKLQGTHE